MSAALLLGSFAAYPKPAYQWLGLAGGAGFIFGAPAIHLSRDNLYGIVSLGMRIGLPLAIGELAGSPTCRDSDRYSNKANCSAFTDWAGGIAVGAVAASVIDAGLLAWTPRRDDARNPAFMISPIVGRSRSGIGISGTF